MLIINNTKSFSLILDAIYASLLEARQTPTAEVVCSTPGQAEKEDHARADHNDSRPEA